ncbi:excinuclease ABC subunit UvrA, partial [Treponema sp.]|uniref:excinuclease ABC subunit UvrA n=1 Tax=Treponema sp. TaxID=166 RepID=UPI002A810609
MNVFDGDKICIQGAREHNLKNISVEIPRNKLVAVSGLSGSGKSSLAFDTLFAEGQRRYMESLSSYARQFLGRMDKPDVDLITGLSPAISIEQKTTHKNPRSTVGTVTEIYDYYRLLFSRIGKAHCPECGREIKEQSVDQIVDTILSWNEGTKLTLIAPVIRGKKGEHQKIIDDAKKSGFVRARIDGLMVELEDSIKLDKQKKHTIEIVVDRIVLKKDIRKRLADSVETALKSSAGIVIALRRVNKGDEAYEEVCKTLDLKGTQYDRNADYIEEEVFFSQKNACPDCGISVPELQPRLFSFNNPFGACPDCTGLGEKMEFDRDLIMPDSSLSFNENGIVPFNPDSAWNESMFGAVFKDMDFDMNAPLKEMNKKQSDILWNGTGERSLKWIYKKQSGEGTSTYNRPWVGIYSELRRRYAEAWGDSARENLEKYMSHKECKSCCGKRLRKEALGVTVGGVNIWDLTELSVSDTIEFFEKLKLTETEKKIASQVLKEITSRLSFLKNVGLDYLTLQRSAATLSGGEAQRIRLSTQIGSGLTGVMYILDEPSIGLHQRDNQRLIDSLLYLRDLGNTVIVVEHDEQTLLTADWLVDIGPGAGVHGGTVMASDTPENVMKNPNSITGKYLAGLIRMPVPKKRRTGNGNFISIQGVTEHNLKNITCDIPLGTFTCITGVSGSGKSTLLNDVFFPAASNKIMKSELPAGEFKKITGLENIDKIINIDQSPIGRTPRSNPVTYIGVFDKIRELYSCMPEAKAMGYKPGRFSFNVKGG